MAVNDRLQFDVDFLPESYRSEGMKRRVQWWQIVVVAVFAALFLVTDLAQRELRSFCEHELLSVDAPYLTSEGQSRDLANLQLQLASTRATAELLTYLRHPWPISQVLTAVTDSLPDSVTLTGIDVTREINKPVAKSPAETLPAPGAVKHPAAEEDLKRLRAEDEGASTVVTVNGTMSDPAELHAYLQALGHNPLFAKAGLSSIASPAGRNDQARFTVRLVLRATHAQPGGQTPPPAVATTARDAKPAQERAR